MYIKSDGKVGIGDSSPAQALDVNGSVRADDYIEYSPFFIGNALEAVMGITYEAGSEDGAWADVDHASLPAGVLAHSTETFMRDTATGEEVEADALLKQLTTNRPRELKADDELEDYIAQNYTTVQKQVAGRNLGNSVQLNLAAIQELAILNDELRQENEDLKAGLAELMARFAQFEKR